MILIVDDNEETRRLMLYLLRTIDRSGVAVASGEQALTYLNSHKDVSCVILDYRMPGMSGLDVVRAIRTDKRLRDLYVLMYSADDGETERRCLEAGANAFVQKGSLDWIGLSRTILAYCGETGDVHPIPPSDTTANDQRAAG